MQNREKKLTPEEARIKIYRYCAYQERCHQEVKAKLFELGLAKKDADELITDLIVEGYLNEERFARAFAGGKFRMKKWGRVKITRELEHRGLTTACIRSGLKEIEEAAYIETLSKILESRNAQSDIDDKYVRRDKIATYAIQKGYESELVWRLIKEMVLE